jgi:hypothetical protein
MDPSHVGTSARRGSRPGSAATLCHRGVVSVQPATRRLLRRLTRGPGYRTSTTGPPIAITMCRDIRLRLSQILVRTKSQ